MVCDLPAAYSFFGLEPMQTRDDIRNCVAKICHDWNDDYRNVKNKAVNATCFVLEKSFLLFL